MVRFLKRRVWWVLIGLLVLAALLAGSVFSLRWIARNRDPGPGVRVEFVDPDDPALVGQSVVVRGQAVHPEGIDLTELWVNGEKVSAQNLEERPTDSNLYFAFQPRAAGIYNIVLKAKSVHGVFGSSSPRLIHALVQESVEDTDSPTQVILQEGDTVESVADEYNVDPEDVVLPEGKSDVAAGDSVIVPEGAEDIEEDTEALGEEESLDDLPDVEPVPPAEELVPLGGDSSGVPFWVELPGVDLVCAALPEACGGGPEDGLPARPGDVLNFPLSDNCQVAVQWTDRSDNETGFRIFRVEPGVTTGLELVGEVPFSPGTGTPRSFLDEFAGRGRFTYIVQAYNGAGHVYMPASGEVETRCDETYSGDRVPLVVEAVSMESDVRRNQIYCYVGLGRGYLERVPNSYGEFIQRQADGTWNIAEHFSGDNRRRVWADRDENLTIRGRCNVRETFMPLPRFHASIPPEHWDGREIIIGPEDGSYQATVRVFFTTESGGGDALVDPDIPPPTNLKEVNHWQRCGFLGSCLTFPGQAIAWEYPTGLGVGDPRAYRVFRQMPGESEKVEVHRSRHPSWSAPAELGSSGCQLGATYSVNAVTGIRDPITGDYIESPPSEEFEVRSECVKIKVTLHDLVVNKIRDNCPGLRCSHNGKVYGTLWIGGEEISWNFHSHSDGSISGDIPSTTRVSEGSEYSWETFYLNNGDGYDTGNNSFIIEIPEEEGMQINWEFKEHDKIGGDDNWCARRDRETLFRLSRERWSEVWGGINVIKGDKEDCEVSIGFQALDE